jgi:hypothetical protein
VVFKALFSLPDYCYLCTCIKRILPYCHSGSVMPHIQ